MSKKKQAINSKKTTESKRAKLESHDKKTGRKKPFDKNSFLMALGLSLALVIIGYLFYSPTINYDLVYCDDNIFVHDYEPYNKDIKNLSGSFEKTVGATYYRPLLASSFIIDYQMGEKNPYVYHRTNVVLHVLASLLVFLFIIKLGYPIIPSFALSLIFTLHPILTPAASWISGRNDSMITIFIILSFLALISFYNQKTYLKWLAYLLHLLAFAMSLFTKEIAIVLPVVALSYSYFYRNDKLISTKNISLAGGWTFVAIVWFMMRKKALTGINSPDEVGLDSFIKNLPSVPAMIGKIFLPIKMIALSNYEWVSIVSGILIAVALTLYILTNKDLRHNKILLGVIWAVLFILPSLVVRIIYVDDFFDYAEHRAYLPMVGIFILVMELLRVSKIDFKKPIPIAIGIILIGAFAARAYVYTPVFQNRNTFWTHMIDTYPTKSRGYLDLGKAYYVKGDLDSAEILYKRGIELNPKNFNLYIDLTAVYLRKGEFNNAVAYGKKALNLDPGNYLANYNYGKALIALGNFKDALKPLEIAVRRRLDPTWLVDLGVAYFKSDELQKAIAAFQRSISIMPNNPLAYSNLGSAYAGMKDYQNAEASWKSAISLNPKDFDALNNLIRLNVMSGRQQEAFQYKDILVKSGGTLASDIHLMQKANPNQ